MTAPLDPADPARFEEMYRDARIAHGLPAATPWDIGGPQPVVQQEAHQRRRPGSLRAGVGVRGGDQGAGLVAGESDGAGVVRIHGGPADPDDRVVAAQVVGGGEAVERRQRREPPRDRRRGRAGTQQSGGVQVHLHPPRVKAVQASGGAPGGVLGSRDGSRVASSPRPSAIRASASDPAPATALRIVVTAKKTTPAPIASSSSSRHVGMPAVKWA